MSLEKVSFTTGLTYGLARAVVVLRAQFYRLLNKNTLGVRAIVVNQDRQVLLVKHTYQPGWYLPGGGIKRGESLGSALTRELYEETGVQLLEAPKLFAIYLATQYGACDYPAVFIADQYRQIQKKSFEIAQVQWFALNGLPPDITPATQRRLLEFFENKPIDTMW